MIQTFLVTGGKGSGGALSSTEILEEGSTAWVFTGELPMATYVLSGAYIDGRIIMTGKIYQ